MAWNAQWAQAQQQLQQQMGSMAAAGFTGMSTAGAAVPGYEHLSAEQQQIMIQQNLQQWQSYYQQYAQWQAQYGQQYQQELNKIQLGGAQAGASVQPPLPDQPPPPPPPPASNEANKPPPPPPPSGAAVASGSGPKGPASSNSAGPSNAGGRNQPYQKHSQNYGFDDGMQQIQGNNNQFFDNFQDGNRGGGQQQQGGPQFDNFNDRGGGQFDNFSNDGNRGGGGGRRNQWNQRGNGNQNNRQFGGPGNNNNNAGRGGRGGRGGNQRGGRGRFGNNNTGQQNNQRGGGGRGGRNRNRFNEDNDYMDNNFSRDMDYGDRGGGGGGGPNNYQTRDMDFGGPNNSNNNYDRDMDYDGGGGGGSNNYNRDMMDSYGGGGNSNCSDNYNRGEPDYSGGGGPSNQSRPMNPQEELRQHLMPTVAQQKQWDAEDDEDERLFDEQFRKWEEQFNNWKVQNQDHPDRNAYLKYERDFEDVRIRLMERRDQMRQRRLNTRQEILRKQKPMDRRQDTPPQYHQQGSTPSYTEGAHPTRPPTREDESLGRNDYEDQERDWAEDADDSSRPSGGGGGGETQGNVDNIFDRFGRGGIPGLDLVEPPPQKEYFDGEEVINLEEEEAATQRREDPHDEDYRERSPEQVRRPTVPQPEDDADVFFDSNLEVQMENIKAKKVEKQKAAATTPEIPSNINDLLKNPHLKSILNQAQGRQEDKPPQNQQQKPPQPNIDELLKNPNIMGVLNQVQSSMGASSSRQPAEPLNMNALLQNPQISNLLNQVQGGLMNQPPPNFNQGWVNGPNGGGRPFGNLPLPFQGNQQMFEGNNVPFSGINPRFQAPPGAGRPPIRSRFDQPRMDGQMNKFNTLPPERIHGGSKPVWSRQIDEGDFQRRPPRVDPSSSAADAPSILVPTKVVDYMHRSASEVSASQTIDYFHKKTPGAVNPPQDRDVTNTYTRNVFTTNNQRWVAKRQCRFDDEKEEEEKRPEEKRFDPKRSRRNDDRRPRRDSHRSMDTGRRREDADRRRGDDRRDRFKKAMGPSKGPNKDGNNEEKATKSNRVEDFLEGISDEELEAIENEQQDDDNMSLSSIEDFPEEVTEVPQEIVTKDGHLVSIADILLNPGRKRRPRKILIIIRGLPGSGKTRIAKLIKDKEVEMGGSAPRILSIDDYFTTETDEVVTCPNTGKDINKKSMLYEYEAEMEGQYLQYLLKAFKKTISDGYFDFIIVDAVYQQMSPVIDIVTHARTKGFVSYICSLECDVVTCFERNIHNRTEEEIANIAEGWESCPAEHLRLDIQPLLEWTEIPEIAMEDISNDEMDEEDSKQQSEAAESGDGPEESVTEEKEEVEVEDEKVEAGEETNMGGEKEGDDAEIQKTDEKEGVDPINKDENSITKEDTVVASDTNLDGEEPLGTPTKDERDSNADEESPKALEEQAETGEEVKVPELDGEIEMGKVDVVANQEEQDDEEEPQQEEPDTQLEEDLENEFEDIADAEDEEPVSELSDEAAEEPQDATLFKSKWDTDPQEDRLAKMDGISKPLRPPTIEDYLQADEYLSSFEDVEPGKKRVRWADIEEKKAQEKMRAIGFVVGQTDWNRMLDPTEGQGALTKTKFIERVKKDDAS